MESYNLIKSSVQEGLTYFEGLNHEDFIKLMILTLASFPFLIILTLLLFSFLVDFSVDYSLLFTNPFKSILALIVLSGSLIYVSIVAKISLLKDLTGEDLEGFNRIVWSFFKYKSLLVFLLMLIMVLVYTTTISIVADIFFTVFIMLFLFTLLVFFLVLLLLTDFIVEKLLLPYSFSESMSLKESFKYLKQVLKKDYKKVIFYFFLHILVKLVNSLTMLLSFTAYLIIICLLFSPVLLFKPGLVRFLSEGFFNHLFLLASFITCIVLSSFLVVFRTFLELNFIGNIHKRINYLMDL